MAALQSYLAAHPGYVMWRMFGVLVPLLYAWLHSDRHNLTLRNHLCIVWRASSGCCISASLERHWVSERCPRAIDREG